MREQIEQEIADRLEQVSQLSLLSFKDFREFKRESALINLEEEIELLESLLK